MFESARLKLTFWYVIIIMIITGFFSLAAYQNLSHELARSIRSFRRIPMQYSPLDSMDGTFSIESDQELFKEARAHLLLSLGVTNVIILLISGAASYFLAGKTLKPIEVMVEGQKQFISDASHELRTPLTALKTEIEVALREKNINEREARSMLQSNLEEVNKMQTLTNYLLSLNRYQSEQTPFLIEPISLGTITQKAMAHVAPQAKKKIIRILNQIKDTQVLGNEISLIELETIILDNAIKYSPPDKNITLSCKEEGKEVVLQIADQGFGIAKKDIDHIFDRFYQAEKSRTKDHGEGFGLGLAIAKSIVLQHHGKISVESEEGIGSTFFIYLSKVSESRTRIAS